MKSQPPTHRHPIWTCLAIAALGLPVSQAVAAPLLTDDFESYTVNDPVTQGGNWKYATFTGGSLLVRDETTATPFGTPNRYVEFDDTSTTGAVRLQSQSFAAASNALTTFSFDFSEPSTGGGSTVNVGYAIDSLDLGSSVNRRINITLDDGSVGSVTGGSSSYSTDTAYRLYIVFNDTASAATYSGGSIESGTAHVWLEELASGITKFAGTTATLNTGTDETSYNVAFRSGGSNTQTIHLDNVSLIEGAPTLPLLNDDFESYTADAAVPTGGNWASMSVTGGSLLVRDETTATPLGTPNQYLEYADTSAAAGVRLQSQPSPAASNAVTTFSFDFSEPTGGGVGALNFGYAIDNGDLTSGNRRIRVTLDDGVVGNVTGGTNNNYSLDTAYRCYLIFNDSGASVDYPGGSIASGTAHVWLKKLSSGTFTFAGTATAENTGIEETSYNVAFRSFNADVQTIHLDNVSLVTGAAEIPDSPPAEGFDLWKIANSATGQTLADDHDGDGVANGVEYFLGGPNDTTGFTELPGVDNNAGTLSVTWTMDAGYPGEYGTHFVVQTSATLADPWTTETKDVTVTITGDDVKYTFPAGTRNFARLKVTGP